MDEVEAIRSSGLDCTMKMPLGRSAECGTGPRRHPFDLMNASPCQRRLRLSSAASCRHQWRLKAPGCWPPATAPGGISGRRGRRATTDALDRPRAIDPRCSPRLGFFANAPELGIRECPTIVETAGIARVFRSRRTDDRDQILTECGNWRCVIESPRRVSTIRCRARRTAIDIALNVTPGR